jgi:hypothetical protein
MLLLNFATNGGIAGSFALGTVRTGHIYPYTSAELTAPDAAKILIVLSILCL